MVHAGLSVHISLTGGDPSVTMSAKSRHSRGSSLTTWYPIDASIWIVAVAAAQFARYDFDLAPTNFGAGFVLAPKFVGARSKS